jgi:hypothetical protein
MSEFDKLPKLLRTLAMLTTSIDPQEVMEPTVEVQPFDHVLGVVDESLIRLSGAVDKIIQYGNGVTDRVCDAIMKQDGDSFRRDKERLLGSSKMYVAGLYSIRSEIELEFGFYHTDEKYVLLRKGWVTVWCLRVDEDARYKAEKEGPNG